MFWALGLQQRTNRQGSCPQDGGDRQSLSRLCGTFKAQCYGTDNGQGEATQKYRQWAGCYTFKQESRPLRRRHLSQDLKQASEVAMWLFERRELKTGEPASAKASLRGGSLSIVLENQQGTVASMAVALTLGGPWGSSGTAWKTLVCYSKNVAFALSDAWGHAGI